MKENNVHKKKSKLIWKILLVLSFVVIAACIAILIKMYMPYKNDTSKYKNTTNAEQTAGYAEETSSEPESPDNPVNFEELWETNPDIYAWITIPNTLVDYPVLQSDENESDSFYLDHNMNKEYEFAGSIYSQKMNGTDFTDPVTVLYGHNMKNKSMFGSLHYFEDSEFFDENEYIYVYTPGHILTYTIASAYIYDNRHIMNTFNFLEEDDFQDYIDSILQPNSMTSNVREGLEITTSDKILTLSTCNGNSAQRYLVQGVLTEDELTK